MESGRFRDEDEEDEDEDEKKNENGEHEAIKSSVDNHSVKLVREQEFSQHSPEN